MEGRKPYQRVIDHMNDTNQQGFSACLRDIVPKLIVSELMSCAGVAVDKPNRAYLDGIVLAMNEQRRPQFLEEAIGSAKMTASGVEIVQRFLQQLPAYRWQQNKISGMTPMQVAVKAGDKSLLEYIFDQEGIPDSETRTTVQAALNEESRREGTALKIATNVPFSLGDKPTKFEIIEYLLEKHVQFDVRPRPQFMDIVVGKGDSGLLNLVLAKELSRSLLSEAHLVLIIEKNLSKSWEVATLHCSKILAKVQDAGILHKAVHRRNLDAVKKILHVRPDFACQEDESRQSTYAVEFLKERENDSKEVINEIREHLLSAILRTQSNASEVKFMFRKSKIPLGQISFNLSAFDTKSHNFRTFMKKITQGTEAERRVFNVQYESTLVYVCSPDLERINGESSDRAAFENQFLDSPADSVEQVDFSMVLNWLRDVCRVKNIIELHVRDSLLFPHSEERIEKVVGLFNVEKLNWKRVDLSIDSVKQAAPAIRELTLYSSGNKAAFYHWFSPRGLYTLSSKLQRVQIIIVKNNVSEERSNFLFGEAKKELEKLRIAFTNMTSAQRSCGVLETPEPRQEFWSIPRGSQIEDRLMISRTLPLDLTGLANFKIWYETAMVAKLKAKQKFKKVKIAVMDNGFDYESLRDFHPVGESFVYQADKEQNWFLPSDLHGTQMATFVTQLNPFCELYLAKVGHSRRDIKSDSVKDAVEWAIEKKVDIISMSFTIKTDYQRRLSKSISKAVNDENGIIVFASTADQGNSEDPYYPAYSNGVIPIACCDEGGEPSQGSDERKAMYLVHGTGFSTPSVDYLQGSTEVKGSSVSTAIAAGVASLVLGCHQLLRGDVEDRRDLIERSFRQMTGGQGRKWLRPDRFFPGANNRLNLSQGETLMKSRFTGKALP